MIIRPTHEQTRRVMRSRAYSGPGFGPRSFECLGIGMGLGLGFSFGAGGSGGPAPLAASLSGVTLLQGCQSHLSLSYSSTMIATGGGPAAGITGTLSAGLIPKPVRVTFTANGTQTTATYAISLDGGATTAQSGTCAASVPIAGLSGLSVTFAAGSYTTSHSYDAAASAWGDPAGSDAAGYTFSGTAQPKITVGVNGYPGLLFDGVDDVGINTTLTVPASFYLRLIYRMLTFTTSAAGAILGPNSNAVSASLYQATVGQVQCYSGASGSTAVYSPGSTLQRVRAPFTASAGDTMRIGAVTGSAASAGATRTGTGRKIGASGDSTTSGFTGFSNCEIFAIYYTSTDPAAKDAAFDTAAGTFYPGLAV